MCSASSAYQKGPLKFVARRFYRSMILRTDISRVLISLNIFIANIPHEFKILTQPLLSGLTGWNPG